MTRWEIKRRQVRVNLMSLWSQRGGEGGVNISAVMLNLGFNHYSPDATEPSSLDLWTTFRRAEYCRVTRALGRERD